jgi:hypothetical protein
MSPLSADSPPGDAGARLRVLELSGAFGVGGTEQAVEIRAALLPAAWFDVRAVGVFGGPRLERLAARGVSTLSFEGKLERLGSLLASFAPHIVHYTRPDRVCGHSQSVQALCSAARVPVVVETNVFGRPAGWPQTRPPDVTAHMSLASMLRCARSAGQSMTELRALGHTAVYLPVPTPSGVGAPGPARELARAELGVAPGELLACRVTRPDLRKWSTRLELALGPMFECVPELRFAFMAAPTQKTSALARRYGKRVILLDSAASHTRVQSLYAAADLMVHSSGIGESFGLSVAEAMFHGLPVVVDSTPDADNAQVEVVQHGTTGLVVRSSRGFVEAVAKLAADAGLRRELATHGRERAEACFSDQVVVGEWVRLYAQAAARAKLPLPSGLAEAGVATPSTFTDRDYATFAERYAAACERTCGPDPDWSELTLARLLRARDTLAYARKVGPATVWRVLVSRLRSGRVLARD